MSQHNDRDYEQMWREFVKNQSEAESMRVALLNGPRAQLLGCLRESLAVPGERIHALRLLKTMPEEDRRAMLPELLGLATWQNQVTEIAKELVFSISRTWLQDNVLRSAEPLLRGSDYQEFWGFLDILQEIDRQKAIELARHLAKHHDREIRDAGETFLSKLVPPP
jgi:hypothetical protein